MNVGYIAAGIVFSILFLPFGIMFKKGNGIRWINFLDGYKEGKYDEEKLLCFLSKFMFSWVGCGSIWILSGILELDWLYYCGLALIIAIAVFVLIYMNTGNRFIK